MRNRICLLVSLIALSFLTSCIKTSSGTTGLPFKETEKGMWGIISSDGQIIYSEEFKSCPTVVQEGMFMVKNDKDLWEIYKCDKKPKKVGTEYTSATLFTNGRALVAEPNKPITLIDTEGKTVKVLDKIDGKTVSAVEQFSEGYAVYRAGEDYGVINQKGESVIPAKYCYINNCSDGKFFAIENKYRESYDNQDTENIVATLLDTKGKEISGISGKTFYLDFTVGFQDGLIPAAIKREGELVWGLANEKQEFVVKPSPTYESISAIHNGMFIYWKGDACGVMNTKGESIIRPKYDLIYFDANDKLWAKTSDGYKLIDKDDNQIGTDKYQDFIPFHALDNQHACVQISDDQWIFIDTEGKELKKLPNIATVEYNTGDSEVTSDYIDFNAHFNEIKLSINGVGGVTFSSTPQQAVKNVAENLSYGNDEHPDTTPYWYDNVSDLSFSHTTNDITAEYEITFNDKLSVWNPEVSGEYAWKNSKIESFKLMFYNIPPIKGKLRPLFKDLVALFKTGSTVVKKNDGAVVLKLSNGKTALVCIMPTAVAVYWGNFADASHIDIDQYKDVKEDTSGDGDYHIYMPYLLDNNESGSEVASDTVCLEDKME